jgi:hypothetical protein
MGAKPILIEKFISACRELDPWIDIQYYEPTKTGAEFAFPHRQENLSIHVDIAWQQIDKLVGNIPALEKFL